MFKKIFEYAGPYKKNMYVATVVVLVSVLMGVLPFVLAYQVISPLVMGDSVETEFVLLRVIGVLICLVLQAFFYGWGLSISHKAAYNTLFRLRVSLQEKFEKLPLGIVEEKGTGTIKKLFVDDADKADCKWSATTIIRILQDETYTGTLVQGKQGTPHYKIKQMEQRPASEWVRVPDAHEALIARQDFELVQRIKGLDTRTSPNEDTVYLFSGILICGCCGSRMTRKTNRANGKEYHYYYCPTGKKKGCAHPVMLKESSLIDCVRDSLKAYIGNIASLEALLTGIDQSSINQALAKEYSDHITDNERRLEQVLEFKARLYESLVGGMLTKEEYASYKAKYTKQAEDIRESVRVLKEKLTEVLENRSERNRWISQFTQFSTLETLDRRALIHMVQSIRVRGKKELDITFTHEDEYKKALQLLALAAQQKDYEQRKVG